MAESLPLADAGLCLEQESIRLNHSAGEILKQEPEEARKSSIATLCSPFRLDRRAGPQTEPVQSGQILL
jgi:hypothetical protein